jgi:hypothetical protein
MSPIVRASPNLHPTRSKMLRTEQPSRDRWHREQLAGGPGRHRLDRWIDGALSHSRAGQDGSHRKIEESWSRFRPNRWLVG